MEDITALHRDNPSWRQQPSPDVLENVILRIRTCTADRNQRFVFIPEQFVEASPAKICLEASQSWCIGFQFVSGDALGDHRALEFLAVLTQRYNHLSFQGLKEVSDLSGPAVFGAFVFFFGGSAFGLIAMGLSLVCKSAHRSNLKDLGSSILSLRSQQRRWNYFCLLLKRVLTKEDSHMQRVQDLSSKFRVRTAVQAARLLLLPVSYFLKACFICFFGGSCLFIFSRGPKKQCFC